MDRIHTHSTDVVVRKGLQVLPPQDFLRLFTVQGRKDILQFQKIFDEVAFQFQIHPGGKCSRKGAGVSSRKEFSRKNRYVPGKPFREIFWRDDLNPQILLGIFWREVYIVSIEK